jgi:hypothetical protein
MEGIIAAFLAVLAFLLVACILAVCVFCWRIIETGGTITRCALCGTTEHATQHHVLAREESVLAKFRQEEKRRANARSSQPPKPAKAKK